MLDIFDILGPIMIGPSSSHTAGAVRIGRMARTLLGEKPVKADIGLYGSFAETGKGHGTDRALVAGLLGMRPDDFRIPESFTVAAEEGLTFTIHPVELREAHPNTAVLTVEGISGKKTCVQAVSIGGGRIRVLAPVWAAPPAAPMRMKGGRQLRPILISFQFFESAYSTRFSPGVVFQPYCPHGTQVKPWASATALNFPLWYFPPRLTSLIPFSRQ